MLKIIAAAILLLTPGIACADVGIPMLALAWPLQWLALIPIVLLECELLRRPLQLSFKQALWPTCKANLLSTIVGIPIAWIAMLSIEFVVGALLEVAHMENSTIANAILVPLSAAWVAGNNDWQTYFAFVILTIPFCVISIYIEERVFRKSFPSLTREAVHPAMMRANVCSYVGLSALALVYPLSA